MEQEQANKRGHGLHVTWGRRVVLTYTSVLVKPGLGLTLWHQWDVGKAIRINVGPLDLALYLQPLKGQELGTQLQNMLPLPI